MYTYLVCMNGWYFQGGGANALPAPSPNETLTRVVLFPRNPGEHEYAKFAAAA